MGGCFSAAKLIRRLVLPPRRSLHKIPSSPSPSQLIIYRKFPVQTQISSVHRGNTGQGRKVVRSGALVIPQPVRTPRRAQHLCAVSCLHARFDHLQAWKDTLRSWTITRLIERQDVWGRRESRSRMPFSGSYCLGCLASELADRALHPVVSMVPRIASAACPEQGPELLHFTRNM